MLFHKTCNTPIKVSIELFEHETEPIELLHLFCDVCGEEIINDDDTEVIDSVTELEKSCPNL